MYIFTLSTKFNWEKFYMNPKQMAFLKHFSSRWLCNSPRWVLTVDTHWPASFSIDIAPLKLFCRLPHPSPPITILVTLKVSSLGSLLFSLCILCPVDLSQSWRFKDQKLTISQIILQPKCLSWALKFADSVIHPTSLFEYPKQVPNGTIFLHV